MNHADEVRIISTLLDHHARRESWKTGEVYHVPIEAYVSPSRLEKERALFEALPQFVGLSSDLPGPNTYCTRDDLSVPTVLTRDRQETARAFVNVCRHRGATVASGRGTAKKLVCPYHAWTYDPDGALTWVPDADSFCGVDPASRPLLQIPLEERDGMLWLQPRQGTAVDLGEHLGGLARELADLELAGYSHWRTERMELDFNWKLVIDTFLEPYHFGSLHRKSIGPYFLSNLCLAESFTPHVWEVLPRKSMLDLQGRPQESWNLFEHAIIVHVLFPNTVLVMLLDHIETWRVYPVGSNPARCVCYLDYYVPPDSTKSDEYWEKNWAQTIGTVLSEDFPAMAGIQRGLSAGVNTHLTVGSNEPALAMFERAVADRLRSKD